jgi:hypothetical protein
MLTMHETSHFVEQLSLGLDEGGLVRELRDILESAGAVGSAHDVADGLDGGVDGLLSREAAIVSLRPCPTRHQRSSDVVVVGSSRMARIARAQ